MAKLTKRAIDSAKPLPASEFRLWCDDPRGFGLRVKSSGVKTFFVQYRSPVTGKKVRHSIGQYGRLSLDEARAKARKLLADVVDDRDPALEQRRKKLEALSKARTISELCDDYMRDARAGRVTYHKRPKKASTLDIDAGRIRRHIKPLLGKRLVIELAPDDVREFLHDVRTGKTAIVEKTGPRGKARVKGGPVAASRTVDLLGSLFTYAVKNGLRDDNPVTGVERPQSKKRDYALNPDEYKRLNSALTALVEEGANWTAVAAFRAIALTGCRSGEILSLRRDAVDAYRQVLRFADTKAGQQLRPIGREALAVIQSVPKKGDSAFVFPATRGDGHLVGTDVFDKAVARAELPSHVTLHTLRHSYASVALELEFSELTIGTLIGHRRHSVTSDYAHHVDRVLIAAADRVADLVAQRMGLAADAGSQSGEVVPLAARA